MGSTKWGYYLTCCSKKQGPGSNKNTSCWNIWGLHFHQRLSLTSGPDSCGGGGVSTFSLPFSGSSWRNPAEGDNSKVGWRWTSRSSVLRDLDTFWEPPRSLGVSSGLKCSQGRFWASWKKLEPCRAITEDGLRSLLGSFGASWIADTWLPAAYAPVAGTAMDGAPGTRSAVVRSHGGLMQTFGRDGSTGSTDKALKFQVIKIMYGMLKILG